MRLIQTMRKHLLRWLSEQTAQKQSILTVQFEFLASEIYDGTYVTEIFGKNLTELSANHRTGLTLPLLTTYEFL
jgi:hypothetical protein